MYDTYNRNGLAIVLSIIAGIIAGVIALGAVIYTTAIDERGDHIVTWNLYQGEFQSGSGNVVYDVDIDEADCGYGFHRTVRMSPVGRHRVSITGHDYNNDGQFNSICYCGNHKLVGQAPKGEFGCNSVIHTENGWKFKPCSADDGVVQPFSDHAINFALAELYTAMYRVHNNDNLIQRWEWYSDLGRIVKVFDKSN